MLTQTVEHCQALPPREGYARRAENYPEVLEQARTFTGLDGLSSGLIYSILIDSFSLLQISRTAFHVLLNLVRHLTADDWAQGTALVWPSNERLARLCDVTTRQVQRALGELESAGLVIRCYTRRHSRMTRNKRQGIEGGIDLAPLGAKLPTLAAAVDAAKADAAERRAAGYRRMDDVSDMSETSRPDDISDTLEQSHFNQSISTVRPDAKASDQSDASRRIADGIKVEGANTNRYSGIATENRSPGGETGFSSRANQQPSISAETPLEAIRRAYRLSPSLQSVVEEGEFENASLDDVMAIFRRAVAALMPQRNTDLTWDWMVRHHGWRAALAFIVALEEPGVTNRSAYFGYFLKSDLPKPLNFTSNFKRIMAAQRSAARAIDTEATDRRASAAPALDGLWGAIVNRLQQSLGAATVAAWISRLQFLDNENGILSIGVASQFARDYVSREFHEAILRAARAEDPTIRALKIEVGMN